MASTIEGGARFVAPQLGLIRKRWLPSRTRGQLPARSAVERSQGPEALA
jgi:hypothetical protein